MGTVIARVSFFAASKDGVEVFIGAGQEVDETHELIKGRESLFEPAADSGEPKKPAKRAAKKAATRKD